MHVLLAWWWIGRFWKYFFMNSSRTTFLRNSFLKKKGKDNISMFALEQYIFTNFRLILYSWCFKRSIRAKRSVRVHYYFENWWMTLGFWTKLVYQKTIFQNQWWTRIDLKKCQAKDDIIYSFVTPPFCDRVLLAKCLVHFNPSYIFEWPRPLGFFKLSLKLVGVARLYSYRSNIESSCLVGLPQTRSWRQPPKWPPKRTNVQVVQSKFIKLRLIWQVPVLGYM